MLFESERRQILEACKNMQEREFFIGTWGNISIRVDDKIILTPSKVDYDTMTLEDMVIIDIDGNKIEGERNATSEKEVHRQIYVNRPDVKAIIHAHTKCCMSVSATDIDCIPCLTEEMSQLLGGEIPLTKEYVPAGEHFKLGEAAAGAINDKSGVILRNHGMVACGKDINEAKLVVNVMEKAAEVYLKLNLCTKIEPIPKRYIESERYRFLYSYGHEKT